MFRRRIISTVIASIYMANLATEASAGPISPWKNDKQLSGLAILAQSKPCSALDDFLGTLSPNRPCMPEGWDDVDAKPPSQPKVPTEKPKVKNNLPQSDEKKHKIDIAIVNSYYKQFFSSAEAVIAIRKRHSQDESRGIVTQQNIKDNKIMDALDIIKSYPDFAYLNYNMFAFNLHQHQSISDGGYIHKVFAETIPLSVMMAGLTVAAWLFYTKDGNAYKEKFNKTVVPNTTRKGQLFIVAMTNVIGQKIRELGGETNQVDVTISNQNGDCGESYHKNLQEKVDNTCKPYPKKCSDGESCASMSSRMSTFSACADARKKINDACHKGGDDGHQIAYTRARQDAAICFGMLNTCRNP